jgi:NAD(P)-dependent dehydrogenase (short-subunit alcohol dehydrogenase family)
MARLQDNVAIVAGGAMGIEVAAAVVFLASGEVSFIAGECVCVSMAV